MTTYRLTRHALAQAIAKGFTPEAVLRAAADPTVTYENGRFAGQVRRIRDGIVAIVDAETGAVITVYENVRETPLRADQRDRDAQRYGARQAR